MMGAMAPPGKGEPMKTTADIAWPNGKAKKGDDVDASSIPPLTLSRWLETGVLVEDDKKVDG